MSVLVPEVSGTCNQLSRCCSALRRRKIKDNGVTYLLVELDPCGLELLHDFTSAEWVGELGLRQTLVLLGLAHVSRGSGASWEGVQGYWYVLRISYLF